MTDETVPQAEVDAWIEGVSNLYYGGVFEAGGDALVAERAVANLWSEFGFLDAPTEVLRCSSWRWRRATSPH